MATLPSTSKKCHLMITITVVICLTVVTIVMMAQQLAQTPDRETWFYAGAGMIAAIAAMVLPDTGHSSEIASVIAVGALALLAGHRWGLLIITIAEALLVGEVWPVLFFPTHQSAITVLVATITALSIVPGLVILGKTIPFTVDVLIGANSRLRSPGVFCCSLLLAVWVVLPAF